MATKQPVVDDREERVELGSKLRNGSLLMALAGVAFIGYGIVFLVLNFVGDGFELGVSTLDGMAKADLNPTVAYYIGHLHVATAAFIISTGIAVAALSGTGCASGSPGRGLPPSSVWHSRYRCTTPRTRSLTTG